MTTEFRKRLPDLPVAGTVVGANEFPIWQSGGLYRASMTALATFMVPLVAGAQPWVDLPTGATVALAGTASPNVRFTGTTTVSSFGTGTDGTRRKCRAAAAFTLTNGANLVLPGGADVAVRADDTWEAYLVGTTQWRVENFTRADGTPLSFVGAPSGMRNRVMNGCFRVDQEFAFTSTTITAAAALKWVADVFYAWCTGANVTAQVVTVSGLNRLRLTGAASNTLVGIGHRIEKLNVSDLAGLTATLSLKVASSSLTSLVWEIYRANTDDTFGTLASPTRTLLGSGTFTGITSTESPQKATISVPGAATTGIEIVLKSAAGLLASQTLTIGEVQFEAGSYANAFERRPAYVEVANVQRYYEKASGAISETFPCPNTGGFAFNYRYQWKVNKRIAPTVTTNFSVGGNVASSTQISSFVDAYIYQVVGTASTNTSFSWQPVGDARLVA